MRSQCSPPVLLARKPVSLGLTKDETYR